MARPHPFNLIYDLEIGDRLLVDPKPGEALENALKRIRLRLSKYKKDKRSYLTALDGPAICVERVPFGLNSKYWPWIKLCQGERILVCENATDKDVRRVQNSIQFLHNQIRYDKLWRWHLDRGNLYVLCVFDANLESKLKEAIPLTPAEILRRDIRFHQGAIENWRRPGSSEGTRAWLDWMCERTEEKIHYLRLELERLESKPAMPPVP